MLQGNGTYKATIVVQSNNLGIPGLVTSGDNIYSVSCDYSQMTGKKQSANATLNVKWAVFLLLHVICLIAAGREASTQLF